MDNQTIQDLRNQHIESYQKAILDIIQNNTNVLMDDIASLIEKPPLDSMDSICNKLYGEAKKHKVILDSEKLNPLLEEYRSHLKDCSEKIKSLRISTLSSKVLHFKVVEDHDVFTLYKKDFTSLNKEIKKILKNQLNESYQEILCKNLSCIFQDSTEESIQNTIMNDFSKFMNGSYQKQLLDSFDIKIMVKDTTLMNSIKEQGERYLFTLDNSRLLNPLD